jgi:hypothetical protein
MPEPTTDERALEPRVQDLLYQTLETELGGVAVYEMALLCARKPELRDEWRKYLAQTRRHVEVMRDLLDTLGLDPCATTPGRLIVRDKGHALVSAMRKALADKPETAQLVAADCVLDAETKDHHNWQLLGELAHARDGELARALTVAVERVEPEEDEHLYHTRGWSRELWLDAVGLPSELPPPEEERDVRSDIEAAREEQRSKAARRGRVEMADKPA